MTQLGQRKYQTAGDVVTQQATRKRQVKGSDKANNITLTCKVSALQLDIILGVLAPNQTIGEWLRLAAVSAAYHEQGRMLLEAASGPVTRQDMDVTL